MIKEKHKRYSDKARTYKINNVQQVFRDKVLLDKMSKEKFMGGIYTYIKRYKENIRVVFVGDNNTITQIVDFKPFDNDFKTIIKDIRAFRKLKHSKRVEIYKLV